MTDREYLCLRYLHDQLYADAWQLGRFIRTNLVDPDKGGSNLQGIGAAVCGRLRKRGLVTYLSDVGAWRITRVGREAYEQHISRTLARRRMS